MRLRLTSLLPCSPERLVAELGLTRRLNDLDHPVLDFTPVDPDALGTTWTPGVHRMRLRVGGRLLIGEHTMDVRSLVAPDEPLASGAVEVWHDAGYSDVVSVWDHRIVLEPFHGMTRYTDVVEIRAGALTLPAWLFASVMYRNRQQRLNRLVAAGFDPAALA